MTTELLKKQRRGEEAAEGMTVQELFDLLNPPWAYEVDDEIRWNKVHEVLPWLLCQAWCFYEGTNNEGPEQSAIGVAAAILDPLGNEQAMANDALENMGILVRSMLEWAELTPSTRAQLEQIEELVGCPFAKKPTQSTGGAS